MLLLMNPEPKLPLHLLRYKYPEREKWSRREISSFQESLLRHGKDFSAVAKEIGSKSREECVMFYQLWKKVCSSEYDRVRTVWKKREAAFTIELLKNIPPPPSTFNRSANSKNGSATNNGYFTEIDGVVHFMPKPTTTSSLSITNNKQDKASVSLDLHFILIWIGWYILTWCFVWFRRNLIKPFLLQLSNPKVLEYMKSSRAKFVESKYHGPVVFLYTQ